MRSFWPLPVKLPARRPSEFGQTYPRFGDIVCDRPVWYGEMMKRTFNTTGPCVPGEHYMLPPEARCPDMVSLIEGRYFFVLHAARQTGKTTLLKSVARHLNASGHCHALYCSLESVQGITDLEKGIAAVVVTLTWATKHHPALKGIVAAVTGTDSTTALKDYLSRLAEASDQPLVVLFDEADCLGNGTLISFLRQLRDGYVTRSEISFVSSLALVGMRNIRDYKVRVREDEKTLGSASPFNISVASLTLSGFTRDEVAALFGQHTEDAGQVFPAALVDRVYERTQGQPWLVNAIARGNRVQSAGWREGPVTHGRYGRRGGRTDRAAAGHPHRQLTGALEGNTCSADH